MTLQSLIIGKQQIETEPQKRKILLGAYLIFTFLGLDVFFLVISLLNPEGEPLSLFLGVFISLICLLLIRQGRINTAIFLHLIRSNLITFYFSMVDTDPYQTGTYIYFISSSIGALAVFGYEERWKGIGFSFLSFVLFLIAFFDLSRFSIDNAHFYFVVNFSIVLLIGMVIIMFFDRLVVTSEKAIFIKNSELTETNSELVKTNEELDRFVYSASHDLRAPLSSMLGLIEIAQQTDDPTELEKYLEMMKGRVHVMEAFIRQIIEYSRNSRLESTREAVGVRSLINEVLDQLRFSSGYESVKIDINFTDELMLTSDKNRLKVIFNNLISNAIKYRNPSTSSFVKITKVEENQFITIGIEDNGIGIPNEHLPKIFDMFYRAHENSKGSGLGLYIVRETITKLGGTIEVTSQVGQGSVFKITLPRAS